MYYGTTELQRLPLQWTDGVQCNNSYFINGKGKAVQAGCKKDTGYLYPIDKDDDRKEFN